MNIVFSVCVWKWLFWIFVSLSSRKLENVDQVTCSREVSSGCWRDEGLLFQSDCQRHLALAGPQEGLQVEGRDVETIFWLQGKFHHARGLIFQPPHIVHPSIAGIFTKGQDYFAQWACSTATSVGNCAGESENSVQASIFGGCPSCWGGGRPSGPQTHTQQANYWRHLQKDSLHFINGLLWDLKQLQKSSSE